MLKLEVGIVLWIGRLDLTCQCNGWIDPEEHLIGRFEARAFSGAIVEFVHGLSHLVIGDVAEISALGKVLPDQAVGILVGAALPGGIGVGEVEAGIKYPSDVGMLGELLAVVHLE